MNITIGTVLVIAAFALIVFGRPDKQGVSPAFLRFKPALVLYPPIILVSLSLGSAMLVFSFIK
jgi:hypothetical protein